MSRKDIILLNVIKSNPDLSITQIADLIKKKKIEGIGKHVSSISRRIKKLVDQGYLKIISKYPVMVQLTTKAIRELRQTQELKRLRKKTEKKKKLEKNLQKDFAKSSLGVTLGVGVGWRFVFSVLRGGLDGLDVGVVEGRLRGLVGGWPVGFRVGVSGSLVVVDVWGSGGLFSDLLVWVVRLVVYLVDVLFSFGVVVDPLSVRVVGPVESSDKLYRFVRVHRLRVKVPIASGNRFLDSWVNVRMRNWVKQVKKYSFPVAVTVEKTTRSVILNYWERYLSYGPKFYTEFLQWILSGLIFVFLELREHGILLDLKGVEVLDQHVAYPLDAFEEMLSDVYHNTVELGRVAKSLTGPMNQEAWVSGDWSHGYKEGETNDLAYDDKVLLMPEFVYKNTIRLMRLEKAYEDFRESIKLYDANIVKHLKVLDEIGRAIKELKDAVKDITKLKKF